VFDGTVEKYIYILWQDFAQLLAD